MSSLSGHKLNLKQALEIQSNQYRSADNKRDYQPEEIDERINEIRANQSERANRMALKRFELAKKELTDIPVKAVKQVRAKTDRPDYAALTVKLQSGAFNERADRSETVELVTEINEFWKITKSNGGYEFLAIPPQILNF